MEMPRIVVIDDEQTIVDSFVLYFSKRGYEIKGVSSPEEALSVLAGEPFDIVITDLYMKPITGFEIINIVREKYPKALLMAMSGKYGQDEVKDLNIDCFFEKPFLFKAVEDVIKERFASGKTA